MVYILVFLCVFYISASNTIISVISKRLTTSVFTIDENN